MHICLPSLNRLHNVSNPAVLLKSLPYKIVVKCTLIFPKNENLLANVMCDSDKLITALVHVIKVCCQVIFINWKNLRKPVSLITHLQLNFNQKQKWATYKHSIQHARSIVRKYKNRFVFQIASETLAFYGLVPLKHVEYEELVVSIRC